MACMLVVIENVYNEIIFSCDEIFQNVLKMLLKLQNDKTSKLTSDKMRQRHGGYMSPSFKDLKLDFCVLLSLN